MPLPFDDRTHGGQLPDDVRQRIDQLWFCYDSADTDGQRCEIAELIEATLVSAIVEHHLGKASTSQLELFAALGGRRVTPSLTS